MYHVALVERRLCIMWYGWYNVSCSTSREETMGGIMYHVALVERRL